MRSSARAAYEYVALLNVMGNCVYFNPKTPNAPCFARQLRTIVVIIAHIKTKDFYAPLDDDQPIFTRRV